MATPTDDAMAQCAACGKGGDGLKKCTACKLVRYCGVDCQRTHRPQHKKACKRRAAEIHDEELFKQPPSREDCPICFLELPIMLSLQEYKSCCGKIICDGCNICHGYSLASTAQSDEFPCPFCRTPIARSDEESRKRLDRRIELNDPFAIFMLGFDYFDGDNGVQHDIVKSLELLHRAAELGSIVAHGLLGEIYFDGKKAPANYKKAEYHLEIAAMAGHVRARQNLGDLELHIGNDHRAMKHFLISASGGDETSMEAIQFGYRHDLVNKDVFEKTVRAHKKSQDELKSEWRDRAAAAAAEEESTG